MLSSIYLDDSQIVVAERQAIEYLNFCILAIIALALPQIVCVCVAFY